MTKPVLVACEFSAIVRDALRAIGIDAWSNDLYASEGDPRWHIRGDMSDAIRMGQWAMIIIHYPCTAMAISGNSTYCYGSPRYGERAAAIVDAMRVWELAKLHAPCVAMENPQSVLFSYLKARKAKVQFVHPWQFGHVENKRTGFALHRLPKLRPTQDVSYMLALTPSAQKNRIHQMPDRISRGHDRSRFLPGMAQAIAQQWGVWSAL